MLMTNQGWGYLHDKACDKRKEKLRQYAEKYIEPAFVNFPELKGKVYLEMRKDGFFAHPYPVYYITIPNNALEVMHESQLRIITAHELFHLVQYENGIGIKEWNINRIERQATFFSFSRGYALDFVKAFPEECTIEKCDMKCKHCYYKGSNIFYKPCRKYTKDEIKELSGLLEEVSRKYSIDDEIDYVKVIEDAVRDLYKKRF